MVSLLSNLRAIFFNRLAAIYIFLSTGLSFLFIHDVLTRRGDLACLVALRLTCVQLIKDEQIPYIDFFDWSQPVIYDLFHFPFYLQNVLNSAHLPSRLEDTTEYILLTLMCLSSLFTFVLFMWARHKLVRQTGAKQSELLPGGESSQVGESSPGVESSQRIELSPEIGLLQEIELATIPFALAPVLLSYFARFQFGETQYLMSLALIPWIALRWLSYQGLALPPAAALCAGAVAGLALSLEVPCALLAVALELTFIALYRRVKPFLSFEILGLVLATAVVWMRINQCPDSMQKAFWDWILPLRVLQWQSLDEMIQGPGSAPELSYVFYLVVLAVFAYIVFGTRIKLLTITASLTICGVALFVLEKQGFTRDIVIAFCGIILTLSLALARISSLIAQALPLKGGMQKFVIGQSLLTIASLIFCAGYLRQIEQDYAEGINPHPRNVPLGTTEINLFVQDNSKWGAPVAIICDYPDPAFPLLFNLERKPGTYLLTGRPLRLLMKLDEVGLKINHWKELDDHIVNTLRAEFTSARADLVLLHGAYIKDYIQKRGLDLDLKKRYSEGGPAMFLSDNRQPREYLGYYFGFDTWHKTPEGK